MKRIWPLGLIEGAGTGRPKIRDPTRQKKSQTLCRTLRAPIRVGERLDKAPGHEESRSLGKLLCQRQAASVQSVRLGRDNRYHRTAARRVSLPPKRLHSVENRRVIFKIPPVGFRWIGPEREG